MRECFTVALKRMGKSLNETDPKVLAEAGEMLKRQHALVRKYSSGDFTTDIASGEVVLAHGYNGQLAKLVIEFPDRIAFVMPKEGGTFSIDNLAIPAKAGNAAGAHAFINFVLEAEVEARIANEVGYASPNAAARKYIKPELLNNPAVYPPADVLDRCEMMKDLGPAMKTVADLWTGVKQG
jgi:spermidine/putrescine transport system substrate-binding protein